MKKNIYYSVAAVAVVVIAGSLTTVSLDDQTVYQPRELSQSNTETFMGAQEYMNSLRANQYTGVVDPKDVAQAKAELADFRKTHGKASYPLSWSFAGPDNRGGRTRALLIDRNDNNVLYAGGVMGGVFKSINKGASWYPVNDHFEDMSGVLVFVKLLTERSISVLVSHSLVEEGRKPLLLDLEVEEYTRVQMTE